jgi:hypothetical protein
MAGYSGTPLPKKLGLKPGQRTAFVRAPPGVLALLEPLPSGVTPARHNEGVDIAVLFTRSADELQADFSGLAERLAPAGMLWVAWPKRASKVPTDLKEDAVRRIGLESGLVDVKVCAIDEIWSGLKFVRRLASRPPTNNALQGTKGGP